MADIVLVALPEHQIFELIEERPQFRSFLVKAPRDFRNIERSVCAADPWLKMGTRCDERGTLVSLTAQLHGQPCPRDREIWWRVELKFDPHWPESFQGAGI